MGAKGKSPRKRETVKRVVDGKIYEEINVKDLTTEDLFLMIKNLSREVIRLKGIIEFFRKEVFKKDILY